MRARANVSSDANPCCFILFAQCVPECLQSALCGLSSDPIAPQEDIHITGKDAFQPHPTFSGHTEAPHRSGAALTAHNLAQFLGLPHQSAAQPGHGLHRDSCATAYNDESWQARGTQTPRWLPSSPQRSSTPVASADDFDPTNGGIAAQATGGAAAAGAVETDISAQAADVAAPVDSSSSGGSSPRSEIEPQAPGDADTVVNDSTEPPEATAAAAAAVAAAAAMERDNAAQQYLASSERSSQRSSKKSATPRAQLQPVNTTLFRPSAGTKPMPAIAEAQSHAPPGPAEPQQAQSSVTASTRGAVKMSAAQLSRKSKQRLQGGKIQYHDGRPKLSALFDAVEAEAKIAGCQRVAVLICGNKHLLRNCLRLVGERQKGEVTFEAHYESFGFV